MEILITALALGLMGSMHCIGMCGPIALSLPLRGHNLEQKLGSGVLYNIGRTTTYGMMGLFFGLIGQSFSMLGFQQGISITMGSIMIATILLPLIFKKQFKVNIDSLTAPIRRAIQRLFQDRSYKGLFLIGLANGLLPCGLVYLAIAGAIGTGSATLGALFMIVFGLGTLPMMMLIGWAGNFVTATARSQMNKAIPYLTLLIGVLFILRGLTLGIPFLSPPKEKLTPQSHLIQEVSKTNQDAVKNACCEPGSETKPQDKKATK